MEAPAALKPGGPAHRAPRKPRRWIRWLGALVVLAALVAIHAVFAHQMKVPIIYDDELGYIENARYLVHGGAAPARTYYPGVSLLLVPVAMWTQAALTMWRSAQVINIAAAVFTALEVVALGGVWGLPPRARWLVGLAASAYPPILLYTDVALSESLFTALFAGLVLLVAVAAKRADTPPKHANPDEGMGVWGFIGLSTVALSLAHPRGFAVIVAVILLAVVILRPVRRHRGAWLALTVGMTLGLALMRIALVATRAVNVGGRQDYEATGVVDRNLNLHAMAGLTSGMVGRLFYLSVATAGLVPFVLLTGTVSLYAVVRGDRRRLQIIKAFVAMSTLGVMALSVLLVNGGSRADELIHGRYVDGVIAPVIVVGLADVIMSRGRRWWVWGLSGIVSIAVTGALLGGTDSFTNLTAPINAINILGIEPLVRRLSNDLVQVLPLVLVGLGATALLCLIASRLPQVAVVLLVVAFVASAIDTQTKYIVPGSVAKARQTVLVNAIQEASSRLGLPRSCVTYDGELDFNYFADRFLLGTQPLDFLDVGAKPCGPLVITARPAFEQRFPGSRLIIQENDVSEDLFVLAGPTQDRLAKAGWLQPVISPASLQLNGQVARIQTDIPPNPSVISGTVPTFTARITNASQVSPWPNEAGLKQGAYAVRLAVRWFGTSQTVSDPGGTTQPMAQSVVELPRSLLPGDHLNVSFPLDPRRADGSALPPGRYQLRLAVYQELAGSFGGGVTMTVNVQAPPPPKQVGASG